MTRARDLASMLHSDGSLNISTSVNLGDNEKVYFGDANDLVIFHNASKSIIEDVGTGNLEVRGTNIEFLDGTGSEYYLTMANNGSVGLYWDGNLKLSTTSTGVDVSGEVTATGYFRIPNNQQGGFFDVAGNNGITLVGSTGSPASTIIAYAGGLERLRIDSSGNVGIGTASPAGKFQVKAATNQNLLVHGSVALPNSVAISAINDITSANVPLEFRYGTNTAFIQDGAERMRIDSTGNVGIGLNGASPASKLHVNGSFRQTGATAPFEWTVNAGATDYYKLNSVGYSDNIIVATAAGNVGIGTASIGEKVTINGSFRAASQDWQMQILNPDTAAANKGGGIAFGGSYTGTVQTYFSNILGAKENGTDGNLAGYLSFYTRSSGAGYTAERMRIDSTGKMGIGTSSPDLKLHVDGSNGYPAASGNTPVGHIAIRAKSQNSSHGAHIGVGDSPPWATWIQAQDINNLATSYPLLLNPNGGNVGIGTNNPANTFVVSQDGNDNIEIGAGFIQRYNRGTSSYGSMSYYAANHNFYTTGSVLHTIMRNNYITSRYTGLGYETINYLRSNGNYTHVKTNIYRGNNMYYIKVVGAGGYSGQNTLSLLTGYAYAPHIGNTTSHYYGVTNLGNHAITDVYYSSDDYLCFMIQSAGYAQYTVTMSSHAAGYNTGQENLIASSIGNSSTARYYA